MIKPVISLISCLCSVVPLYRAQQLPLLGKPASQGPTIGSYVANLAIDGNTATYALSSSPHVPDNMAWWMVDLGGTYPVQSVSVTNGYNFDITNLYNLENFDIYIVTDQNLYILCQRYSGQPFASGETKNLPCNGTSGRWIYIKKVAGGVRNELALAELTMFLVGSKTNSDKNTPNDGTQSIPLTGKTATQASTGGNHEANLAVDGNVNTYSLSASPYPPSNMAWWMVDLGGTYPVISISVTNPYNDDNGYHLENFSIYVVNDQNVYSTCKSYTAPLFVGGETKAISCDTGAINGRWIYIKKMSGGISNDLALAEVRVAVNSSVSSNTTNKNNGSEGGSTANSNPLKGYFTSQSGTWGDHYSYLAIDGDLSTYSTACVLCDNTTTSGYGWWKIDLGKDYSITAVEVISSPFMPDSNYLQEIQVGVSLQDSNSFEKLCNVYTSRGVDIFANQRIYLLCVQPLVGRYVKVVRMPNALIRPDVISIAELRLYGPDNKPIVFEPKSTNIQAIVGVTATQSGNLSVYYAGMALDGRYDTYAIALKNLANQFAWWQADLGVLYYVTDVNITSSQDYTSSQYLQSISIEVSTLAYDADPQFGKTVNCSYRSSVDTVPPSTTYNIKCNSPILGRYLTIRRINDGTFRPDILAIAEVQIFGYKP